MDVQTKQAITRLAVAIDSIAGMTAGIAAYVATLEGSAFVDRRKAVGLAQKMVPEGLSGSSAASPAMAAQAMIEQISSLAKNLEALKSRLDRPAQIVTEREASPEKVLRDGGLRALSRFTKGG